MAIRRRDAKVTETGALRLPGRCEWIAGQLLLWEFMTACKYEDGSARGLPSLTIFVDDQCLKACLNDRDQSQVAFVASDTLEGLWEALASGLEENTLDWRSSQQKKRK